MTIALLGSFKLLTCRGAANNWLEGKGEHLGGGDCMLCFRLFQAKKKINMCTTMHYLHYR
jgi:hypothetical protein